MFQYPLRLLAIGALAMLSATTAASAGCCPDIASPCGCQPVLVPQAVAPSVEMLVVNQGPVYSGPGSYVTQRNFIENDQVVPRHFPPVGFVPADRASEDDRDTTSAEQAAPAKATRGRKR